MSGNNRITAKQPRLLITKSKKHDIRLANIVFSKPRYSLYYFCDATAATAVSRPFREASNFEICESMLAVLSQPLAFI